ncbi:MAG: hypothetical protein M3Y50_10025 [Acidobacteriota bacterium]|nr:hypothetical protein [Acidobacteriota bacterium]
MQNAKDTFYVMLRDRLAAINPSRTIVVRGTIRPGTLVEENELVSAELPVDAFALQWTTASVNTRGALPLVTLRCSIRYATDGDSGNGGMDRGRLLSGMDAELVTAIGASPQSTPKTNFVALAGASAAAPTVMATNIFWSDVAFGPTTVTRERIERVATVEVFSYQEAGEL